MGEDSEEGRRGDGMEEEGGREMGEIREASSAADWCAAC